MRAEKKAMGAERGAQEATGALDDVAPYVAATPSNAIARKAVGKARRAKKKTDGTNC